MGGGKDGIQYRRFERDIETARAEKPYEVSAMTQPSSEHESDVATQEEIRTKTPKQYKVLLLNDDFTTMEFVVHILETLFMKSPSEAVQIMLQVHKNGRGIAGVFSKQIAEAKIEQVHQRARSEGFPLRCMMEEA